jgi:hypothetical protein
VGDLIVGLIAAFLFAIALAIALMVAVAVLAAAMLTTTIWAFGEGFVAFAGNFKTSIVERGGARRKPKAPEPAFEIYMLGQIFDDFRHGLEYSAEKLGSVRQRLGKFASKYQSGPTMPVSIGAVIGGYVGTAIAGVLGIVAGLVIGVVVGVSAACSWALIWLLRGADAVRRRVRHASYECPTDHERFSLPVYICPGCGAEHSRLVPGRWGILKRECECGKTALPTTVIRGRQRVPQRCPWGHSMSGFLGFAENLPIAIVGGPSAGKSTFLAGALVEIENPAAGVSLQPLVESRDAYARLIDAMQLGSPPEKTTDERRPALVAEVQGSGRSRALYAYDLAGEVYSAEDKVRGLRFLTHSAGIVMLIDPFSIRNVAEDRAEEIANHVSQILPSSEEPMRVYERLLATLKEAGAHTADMPLAVVVAKSDAFGIGTEIDDFAKTVGADTAARAWLNANGAGNLVRSIEQDFKKISWFSVSALGRMPDPAVSKPFVPRGALAPLLWILACRDVHPSPDASPAAHTAEDLVGTEADFPAPSASARARNAAIVAAAAAALLVVAGVAVASIVGRDAASGGSSTTLAGVGAPNGGGSNGQAATTTGSTTTSTNAGKTYPLMAPGNSHVVRQDPSESSAEVGKIAANTEVSIMCTAQGETVDGNTLWDRIASPNGYVTDTAINTGTQNAAAGPCSGKNKKATSAAVPAPTRVMREHLEQLDHSNYSGAFSLMSAAYRAENPGWVSNREAADPMINIVKVDTPHYSDASAYVYVTFYARDRNPTQGSDTQCRRFEGVAQLVSESGGWRYNPKGSDLSTIIEPSGDSNCHS